jgi:UDP-glucose 4-epimerase
MIANQKILISGAKGFIGSNLVDALRDNNEIVAVDNLLHAPNPHEFPNVHYLNVSVSEAIHRLSNDKFDLFFHFGEYARVERSVAEPMVAFENSTASIVSVIRFCIANNIKLVYSGSSTKFAHYSDGQESPYAIFKKYNTTLINAFAEFSDLDYAISYFYNVYGPGESSDSKYGTVIKKFIDLVNSGHEKLPVTLPGSQQRNFTHIDDTISALMLIAQSGVGDGYGICAKESYSILELVSMLGSEPDWQPAKVGNRDHGLDMSEKTRALGWEQHNKLEDYLKEQLSERL